MTKKLKSSLTAKIFLVTALLLAVCCFATYSFIAWMIPKTYPGKIDLDGVEVFAEHITVEFQHTDYRDFEVIAADIERNARAQYGNDLELHIYDTAGSEIYGSGGVKNSIDTYDTSIRTDIRNVVFSGSNEEFSFFFTDGAQVVNQALEAVNKVFPYLITTIFLISIVAALVYSKYITAPIKKINCVSKRMAALDFSVRCDGNRADELGSVASTMNLLAEKLSLTLGELENANAKLLADFNREKSMEKQRTELFSAVSHELKTPITIVKGQLQGMIAGVGRYKDRDIYLAYSLEAVMNLEKMVQELLTVARMESTDYTCHREPFDLAVLINQCLTAQEDLFIQKDMRLIRTLPKSMTYNGDKQLLKGVFDNLIANALAYSPQGQFIEVALTEDNLGIKFSIENVGVHIDETDLPRLFEAFFRTDQSRNRQTGGSGLGLYIVRKILDLHSATYSMNNTEKGVIFTANL